MKIVKMHEGSREAFDDFLEQKLNELEIDNGVADRYFASMNLPVPVIPLHSISFFDQHKNKLWLVVLFFGVITFSLFLINNNLNSNNENITKASTTVRNAISNNVVVKSETKPIIKLDKSNENIRLSNTEAGTINNSNIINIESETFLKQKNKRIINTNNNYAVSDLKQKKMTQLDNQNYLSDVYKKDTISSDNKFFNKKVGQQTINKLKKSNTIQNQKIVPRIDNKQSDSLYIIW